MPSRQAAQEAVTSGRVVVDGMPTPKPSSMVGEGTALRIEGPPRRFVSRGGDKLAGALDAFGIDVSGRRCLDAGASTGGFTDCLLQRGAAGVVAVDVGYGQLDWALRNDARVTPVERTNIRLVELSTLGGPFDVVVADLSFISLAMVAPQLAAASAEDADLVLLVKPQFEAGRDDVGRGGVVKDPSVHRRCIAAVANAFADEGKPAAGVVRSSLDGPAGNREFLLWCRSDGTGLSPTALDEVAA